MDMTSEAPDFDHIFTNVLCLHHKFLTEAHKWFDRLRNTRRKIIAEGISAEARCCSLFAISGAGKSKVVRSYMNGPVIDYCLEVGLFPPSTPRNTVAQLQRKVIYVSVSGASTLTSLLEDLLRAFGDPRPQRGTNGAKMDRLLTYIREFGTELIIFDEMNHLKIGSSSATQAAEATRVHNTLKDFLLGGCPIVFTGTVEAKNKVFSDPQIRDRCVKQLFIGPLNSGKPDQYLDYSDFVGRLGLELKRLGIFPERSNFMDKRTVAALFEASGRYYGHTTNIVALACNFAYEQGSTTVDWSHLEMATDEYTMFNDLCDDNPFTRRRQAEELEARKARVSVDA